MVYRAHAETARIALQTGDIPLLKFEFRLPDKRTIAENPQSILMHLTVPDLRTCYNE
jgi:hypothetical protein